MRQSNMLYFFDPVALQYLATKDGNLFDVPKWQLAYVVLFSCSMYACADRK